MGQILYNLIELFHVLFPYVPNSDLPNDPGVLQHAPSKRSSGQDITSDPMHEWTDVYQSRLHPRGVLRSMKRRMGRLRQRTKRTRRRRTMKSLTERPRERRTRASRTVRSLIIRTTRSVRVKMPVDPENPKSPNTDLADFWGILRGLIAVCNPESWK